MAGGDDDEVYSDYVESTVDPGQTLFIIAVFTCATSVVGLPLFVRLEKCLTAGADGGDQSEERGAFVADAGTSARRRTPSQSQTDADLSLIQRFRRSSYRALVFVLQNAVRIRRRTRSNSTDDMGRRTNAVSRGLVLEMRRSMRNQKSTTCVAVGEGERSTAELTRPQSHVRGDGEIGPRDPENIMMPQTSTQTCYDFLRNKMQFIWSIAKYDNESNRIIRLAVPFTISAIIETASDLFILAIISHNLGTDSMIAYVMVDVIVGISSSFMGGWVEAVSSLGSMAYGADNYELAGQYVQAASICFVLSMIPFVFIWGMTIGSILQLMGFNEQVQVLANEYVYAIVIMDMIDGVSGECIRHSLHIPFILE